MDNYNEIIDKYVSDKLTDQEKIDFSNMIDGDPSLAQEISLQEDIVSGLKEQRKAELKARLSSLEVPAGMSLTTKAIIAGSVIATLFIGWTTYSNLKDTPTAQVLETVDNEKVNMNPTVKEVITKQETASSSNNSAADASKPQLESVEANAVNTSQVTEPTLVDISAEEVLIVDVNTNAIVHDDISEPDMDEDVTITKGIHDVPNHNLGQTDTKNASNSHHIDIVTSKNKEIQYTWNKRSDKLTFFGKFDKSAPYFLIDMVDSDQLYLKYQGDYYFLINSKEKLRLEDSKVTDERLISNLEKKSN